MHEAAISLCIIGNWKYGVGMNSGLSSAVERNFSKVDVIGSIPIARSNSEGIIQNLRNQLSLANEKISQLEKALSPEGGFFIFKLTKTQEMILSVLYRRQYVSVDTIEMILYNDEKDVKSNIVKVYICQMRKKLKPLGIKISTKWAVGYYLTENDKAKIKRVMGEA